MLSMKHMSLVFPHLVKPVMAVLVDRNRYAYGFSKPLTKITSPFVVYVDRDIPFGTELWMELVSPAGVIGEVHVVSSSVYPTQSGDEMYIVATSIWR